MQKRSRFQSSPNPQTGCDVAASHQSGAGMDVSILTQSSDWVRPSRRAPGSGRRQPVSILTQSSDWVRLRLMQVRDVSIVSILTQSSDWVRRWPRHPHISHSRFQSSPNPQTGCDGVPPAHRLVGVHRFNPHPILRLGATVAPRIVGRSRRCFNPHPILRLGATSGLWRKCVQRRVSILTQSSDWVRH